MIRLKGILDNIGSDLLRALSDTDHDDLIFIGDHFYPPVTKFPNATGIQAKETTTVQMVDAL